MSDKSMDQLQGEIKGLEAERSTLNPTVDRFQIAQIDQRIAELRGQAQALAAEEQANQLHEEVQDIVLSSDFNTALGHPDANKIIYTLLYETKQRHLEELTVKNAEIQAVQTERDQEVEQRVAAAQEAGLLRESLAKAVAERDQYEEGNEALLNETRTLRNETARLQTQIKTLEGKLELAERQAQTVAPPSDSLSALLADAAKTTASRRKIKDVEPVDARKTAYTATDEAGNRITIPWLEIGKYEQVDSFPVAPPAGDQVEQEITEDDIAAQQHEVAAAAEEAARFPDVVSGDGAGPEAEDGAAEAVGDDHDEAAAAAPEESLEARVAALEAWRQSVEERIAGLAFQR